MTTFVRSRFQRVAPGRRYGIELHAYGRRFSKKERADRIALVEPRERLVELCALRSHVGGTGGAHFAELDRDVAARMRRLPASLIAAPAPSSCHESQSVPTIIERTAPAPRPTT